MTGIYDVAIIGGGPAGSTTAGFLRKCHDASVVVLEREAFPREHVGESQLPSIGAILDELGCWDAVERAGFPVKVGATLRWGATPEQWSIDFVPGGKLPADHRRPAPFRAERCRTALQVDRGKYDQILLRHAAGLGAEVREQTAVTEVERDGDRITGLRLFDGSRVEAKWYVDASGSAGTLRRAMGVAVDYPAALRNVAVWGYWEDPRWVATEDAVGTRLRVLSVGYGWVWFILIGASRASVGLVVPAAYYKQSGRTLEDLYAETLASDAVVAALLGEAEQTGECRTIRDWSFLAERASGENWFLVGETVGFADPILSAGMALAHSGGRELGYTLAALVAGQHDPKWLREHYDATQRGRIRQHIRFADFWYACNGQFTDLQDHCRTIAADAGLQLEPIEAWRWLALGGFANDVPGQATIGFYDLASLKGVSTRLFADAPTWKLSSVNRLELAIEGAATSDVPYYRDGQIVPIRAFDRGGRRLHMLGPIGLALQHVVKYPRTPELVAALEASLVQHFGPGSQEAARYQALQALELLLEEGWVRGSVEPGRPFVVLSTPREGKLLHTHRDEDVG